MAATEATVAVKKIIDSILSHSVVVEAASQANLGGAGVAGGGSNGSPGEVASANDPTTHVLEVKWSDGSTSLEPVSLLVRDPDHLLCVVQYLHQHNLLIQTAIGSSSSSNQDDDGTAASTWSQQLPEHIREQLPIVLLPDESHPTCAYDLQHLGVIDRALCKGFPGLTRPSGRKGLEDNSYRRLREGAFEIFVAGASCFVGDILPCPWFGRLVSFSSNA
jgi:hypothetical protein